MKCTPPVAANPPGQCRFAPPGSGRSPAARFTPWSPRRDRSILSHLFGILAFAASVIVAVRRASIRPPNLAMAFAALWVLWSALTYFWSLDRQPTLLRAITLAELLAMVWLIWDACRTPLRQTRLMQFYVWGAVAASASAFLRYFQGRQTYYRRYTAPGFDPNDFGLILALSIPIALYLALRARGWERWCYRAAVLTVLSAVLLTASRTALIATFAAFAFALWTWREADRWPPAACGAPADETIMVTGVTT
jgi:hypothetical protein